MAAWRLVFTAEPKPAGSTPLSQPVSPNAFSFHAMPDPSRGTPPAVHWSSRSLDAAETSFTTTCPRAPSASTAKTTAKQMDRRWVIGFMAGQRGCSATLAEKSENARHDTTGKPPASREMLPSPSPLLHNATPDSPSCKIMGVETAKFQDATGTLTGLV